MDNNFISIDLDSDEPLFNQLILQIKQLVDEGSLKPGDSLPSIRRLAADLDLGNKTVAKAYSLLERDQIIQSKGYRGSFVHPNAKENSQKDLKTWLAKEITTDIARYRASGATDSEIRIAFANAMSHS